MLALTLAPAEAWNAPANDSAYRGFDRNLLYSSVEGIGSVSVYPSAADLSAGAASQVSLNLATSMMPKIAATVDVAVLTNNGAVQPFRIGFWSPWTEAGRFVVFGPAPANVVIAQTIDGGTNGTILEGGTVTESTVLGHYRPGDSNRLTLALDRVAGTITTTFLGRDGSRSEATASTRIFGNVQVSLTAAASGESAPDHAVLSNYRLTLPHQRLWASKIADPRATAIQLGLAVLGGVLLLIGLVAGFRGQRITTPSEPGPRGSIGVAPMVLAGALAVYLIGNVLLFPLGGHPFDMADERLYAYVGAVYGPAQLFYLPNTVSFAAIWNGVPFVEAAFPYEPVSAYLHTAIGWLTQLISGSSLTPNSGEIEYVTKAVNVAFGLGDAVLIYLILRQVGATERWSVAGGGLFLFNPAVWFSMSVWGQTHVMSLFLVLASVILAERRHPTPAWMALAAACLTRPQMLVFGLLVGIVLIRKFPWRETVMAVSWTVIVVFIALLPLTLPMSPSLPVDVLLHIVNVQEAGGNVSNLTTVSQDAYSIWPLVTYLAHGASGLMRVATPSSADLVGSLTYQRASQILTIGAILLLAGLLVVGRRFTDRAGAYLPVVALGIMSFVMFLTGIVATHFLLALPFFLLLQRWVGTTTYLFVAIVWTITTLVPMYGDMGAALTGLGYPLLGPEHNVVTKYVIELYAWDRFITVGVVANLCAVALLGYVTFRQAFVVRVA